ncbi:phosphomethylpyrimidine synthase ThiC [Candidatus Fermentibacteria bacterium]|nr:phosphomethylpyrimidine synthase ThiC [Candidatus Fermentibacteria bacterium]
MATNIENSLRGKSSEVIDAAARTEGCPPDFILQGLADGTIVVPANNTRKLRRPCAIGRGLSVKINANIGSSEDVDSIEDELEKLRAAVAFGSDTVMDLSTGARWRETLEQVLRNSPLPVGTVPLYEVFSKAVREGRAIPEVTEDEMFEAVEDHCRTGVDFLTLHCGVTRRAVELLKDQGRKLGIVSRGGSLLAEWMHGNQRENPLYEHFDRLVEILHRYDATFSLGDGLRPGCISDASDRAQIEELLTLGELQKRSLQAGVQVMIEGPGHVAMDRIAENVRMQKSVCNGAPFYVLGPIVTDVAPGYDDITSAIGGALAAWYGADFLCYVTPAEHLRLPDADDVRRGVVASRIAAHAADIARGHPGASDSDDQMAKARHDFDWDRQYELALDPARAREERGQSLPSDSDVCSMCSRLCAIKTSRRAIEDG